MMRPADTFRTGAVVRATETDFKLVEWFDPATNQCRLSGHCRLKGVLGQAMQAYLAVLDGVPEGENGVIDLPLAKVSSREAGWRMVGDQNGKAARTAWRLIRSEGGRSLVEFRPETGRTHQSRVHAAEGLGCPVVGDPVYGRADPAGMLLHAAALSIPRDGKPPVAAEAPLPERFAAAGFGHE